MSSIAIPTAEIAKPRSRQQNWNLPRVYAWVAVIIGAGASKILCSQFGLRPGVWLPLGETVLLLCFAALVAKQYSANKLAGFIVAIAAANFSWRVAVPWIEASRIAHSLSQHLDWAGQFFLSRAIRTVGAALMLLTLVGSNIGPRELFLRTGNWHAPVKPQSFFPTKWRISWVHLMVLFLLVAGIVLPAFLFHKLHPQIGRLYEFFWMLPWAIAISALNAANEEFQFRSVLLARLRDVVYPRQAILLVAAFFGLSHYFGQPAGWAGVVMAGGAGWFWAKSMIETRGFTCAFLSHFVQDFVIFAFLAMSGASFPKG